MSPTNRKAKRARCKARRAERKRASCEACGGEGLIVTWRHTASSFDGGVTFVDNDPEQHDVCTKCWGGKGRGGYTVPDETDDLPF